MIKHSIYLFSSLVVLIVGLPRQSEYNSKSYDHQYKVPEKVKVDLYYESLCPDCILEYSELPHIVSKLGDYIALQTYPYGNAHMHEEDGKTKVVCQHGESECYGNILHACAIDHLQHNASVYVPYNACLMQKHSDDSAADECGVSQNIDSEVIKTCAKSERGHELLVFYGQESAKVKYAGVPFVCINGTPKPDEQDLKQAVCDAIKNPPDECNTITILESFRKIFGGN